jgi:putative oxidoreductase
MNARQVIEAIEGRLAPLAGYLVSPLQFATRLYVGWVFVKSGWLKLSDWSSTLFLFESEYHVPVLPPHLAAIVGTAGELGCGTLVILGLFGRAGALGLFAVNAMAVISYRHVLLQDGFEAAIGQHILWAFMLLSLVVHGPGRWSVDGLALRPAAGAGFAAPKARPIA